MKNKGTVLHPYCRLGCALILFAGIAPLPSLAAETAAKTDAVGHRLLLVGPERALKLPSAAAKIARPGDRIDAGVYRDCAVWRTANITIEGVGGYAHVKDVTCHRKAIWVFYASPVRISNVRFSGARVQHRNGAGIRWEGSGRLTLRNTWFHNNQMGILTHNERQSEMVISDSRFEQNGDCPTFCGHGVYAGRIAYLSITNSRFAGQKFGHHIKSRALDSNIIANRLLDGATGTASYAINLPDSGTATIRNNYIEKGPLSDNVKALIAIGEEGKVVNPSRFIKIEDNVFQNNTSRRTNFIWNRGSHPVTTQNNIFRGPGIGYRKGRGPTQ
ncbi:MAG: right-handed parallel beta-helix repeat-containing protein [Proteobacteria bacterium]|nr:right-handed parallel beta-helix repeat-containing protein [Pseudomonadota bacterium]